MTIFLFYKKKLDFGVDSVIIIVMTITELDEKDLGVIFDVLNVYDPNDIQQVYPKMGEKEFLDDVRIIWEKVLKILNEKGNN
jgi:hypothetical protein